VPIQEETSVLLRAKSWHSAHVDVIIHELYRRNYSSARELLSGAWQQLPVSGLSMEYMQITRYRLYYIRFQIESLDSQPSSPRQALRDMLGGMDEEPAGALSQSTRDRLRLQARISADSLGIEVLDSEEFDRLYTKESRITENAELWFYITSWAYQHQRGDLIELALEFLTFHASGYQADYVWQRVHLMHLLLNGLAQKVDLLELIRRIEHRRQWELTQQTLWPGCIAAGLVDRQVEAALSARLMSLSNEPPRVARAEPAAGSLRLEYAQ
jgi:hypothetical protein